LRELAERRVAAVLTGHVHDAFDLVAQTEAGPIRMIGAGTLSQRIRSTPPSFNELRIKEDDIAVRVRNVEAVPTPDMQIADVPPDALPPRTPGEPVAPIDAVPPIDPPVH
ncbi:metallophosphoesterase, partial [Klebsiella pneumoniae]|nr:metallophosphoesterase [Klebsiella pneumoniae]